MVYEEKTKDNYSKDETTVTPCTDCSERVAGVRCPTCVNRKYRSISYYAHAVGTKFDKFLFGKPPEKPKDSKKC